MLTKKLNDYDQYRQDLFTKLDFPFEKGKKMLEIGCGRGIDSKIFKDIYELDVLATDIYENEEVAAKDINFKIADVLDLPFENNSFDYVFMLDVLHHVDEENQDRRLHLKALEEVQRVLKKDGTLIVVEATRYNPLFFPHMVVARGHDHFTYNYFRDLVRKSCKNIELRSFELHFYPWGPRFMWQVYEYLMENVLPERFIAYNVALVGKKV